MELIKKFPEELDQRTIYKMMKSSEIKRMSDADGSTLEVTAWIVYTDEDFRTGEVHEVLTIQTADNEMFATISGIFQREFRDIIKFFGDDVGMIKVISGRSKNGRSFITCAVD